MSNLFYDIYVETNGSVDGKYTCEKHKVRSFRYSSNELNSDVLENLKFIVRKTKGDWVSFKYSYFNETYYVDAYLIFHNKNLSLDENKKIQDTIIACEKYFKDNNYKILNNSINNADKLSQIFDSEGFILNISEGDGGAILDNKEIEEIFGKIGVRYEILNLTKSTFDGGASGGSEQLLYFVMASAASGITWDIIKPMLIGNLKIPIQCITIKILDKYNFSKLRKNLADKIGEEEKNLILIEMHNGNSKIKLKFRTQSKIIDISCDKSYNISSLKVTDQDIV